METPNRSEYYRARRQKLREEGLDRKTRDRKSREGAAQLADMMAMHAYLRTLRDDEGDWQEAALCAQTDPELFFPPDKETERTAKKICGECTVRVACLAFALENDEPWGVWGGLSKKERLKVKERSIASSQAS